MLCLSELRDVKCGGVGMYVCMSWDSASRTGRLISRERTTVLVCSAGKTISDPVDFQVVRPVAELCLKLFNSCYWVVNCALLSTKIFSILNPKQLFKRTNQQPFCNSNSCPLCTYHFGVISNRGDEVEFICTKSEFR